MMTRALLAGVLLLSACAPYVRSYVTVFHQAAGLGPGATYALIPYKEQEESLEYQSYASAVKRELEAHGLREAPLASAGAGVSFAYGTDNGTDVVYSYPIYGPNGVSSSFTYGTRTKSGAYSSNTVYSPSFGIVGSQVAASRQYKRFLTLSIVDLKGEGDKPRKLFEARVVSHGESAEISTVLPTMVKSLFEDFPGKNGSTRLSSRHPEP